MNNNSNLIWISFAVWLLWLAPALLISLSNITAYTYDLLRFYFAGGLVVTATISCWLYKGNIRQPALGWALLWAGWLALVTWHYRHLPYSWLELYQLAVFVPAFMLAGWVLAQRLWLDKVIFSFIHVLPVVAFFYAAGCIYTYIFALLDQQPRLATFLPWGFLNIRYWSQVASWALPLLPLSLLISPLKNNPRWKFLVYFTMAIWVWVLILSTARGSMFSLIVSFALCFLIFKGQCKEWLIILLKAIALGVVVWGVLSLLVHPYFVEDGQLRNFSVTSSGRTTLWKEALAMSWQNFPFGMGPFSWVTHSYFTEGARALPLFGHPHNHILLWAAEYGWLSIVPLLGIAGYIVKRLRLLIRSNKIGLVHIAFLSSVLAACSHSLLSAVFITPYSLMFGLAVLALFWGLLHGNPKVEANEKPCIAPLVFKVTAVALFLLGGYWIAFTYDYYVQSNIVIEENIQSVRGMNSPRFFEHTVTLKD